ncbi:hypothetical protein, partial [Klebsiella pneumoniae]
QRRREIHHLQNDVRRQYQGKPYVQLNGGSWVPYPQ